MHPTVSGSSPTSGWLVSRSLCALVLLVTLPPDQVAAQRPEAPAQNAIAGSRVFGAKGCVTCHAIRGLGGTEGPDLAQLPTRRSFYDLAAAMWNHLPTMAARMRTLGVARPQLTSREVADLIAFLYVLDYFEASGDAAVGKRIFWEKRCIACHRVGDVGGVVGPDLSPSSRYVTPIQMAAAMWNHGPAMSEAMQVRGIARPRFTSAELRDLIAYVEADQPDVPSDPVFVLPGFAGDGQRVFTEKGCSECHAVRGSGGRIGPDLAERRVSPSILAFAVAMWNKAPAMTRATAARGASIPRLLPGEMADIVGYLYAVNYFAESGNPARGPHLLNRKGCLKCHSGNGREGASAGRLGTSERFASRAAVIAALWNHVLLGELAEAGAGRWPQLRPADLADLTAFLQRPMR